MNNTNKEIIKLNETLTEDFQARVSEKNVASKKFFHKEVSENIFLLNKTSKTLLKDTVYEKEVLKDLIECDLDSLALFKYLMYPKFTEAAQKEQLAPLFKVKLEKLENFLIQFEKEINQSSLEVYKKQLESRESGYLSIIEAIRNESLIKEEKMSAIIDNKDLFIESGINELGKLQKENDRIKSEKEKIEGKVDSLMNLISPGNSESVSNNKDVSKLTTEQLKEKVVYLVKKDLFNKCSTFKLENKIDHLNGKIEIFNFEKKGWEKLFKKWNDAVLREDQRKSNQVERFNKVTKENLKLLDNLYSLKEELSKEKENVKNLKRDLENKVTLFVDVEEAAKLLKKTNLVLKTKFISLLVLDSARNFLPGKVGNLITYAETFLLVNEVSSRGSFTLALVILFFVYSVVLGVLSLVSYLLKFLSLFSSKPKSNKSNNLLSDDSSKTK